jgi:hypothetical protein
MHCANNTVQEEFIADNTPNPSATYAQPMQTLQATIKQLHQTPQQVRAATPPKILSTEGRGDLVSSPINLDFSSIYILIDSNHAVVDIIVLLFTLLEDLEYEIAADGRIVCVAKVLVNALLEGFNTLA